MIKSYVYSRLSGLRSELRQRFSHESGEKFVFMLPAMSSENMLLDMLAPELGYIGETPEVWGWSTLYGKIVPRSELRRQIDPPDHMLVLLFLRDRMLEEQDRLKIQLPSGVRRRGFLNMLSDAIKELLLEDVSPDKLLVTGKQSAAGDCLTSEEILSMLYGDYLFYLEENGLADNSQIPALIRSSLRSTAHLPNALCGKTICWVGFLSLTGSQLKLVRALDRLGAKMEFFIPDTGLESFYDIAEQLDIKPHRGAGLGGRVIQVIAADISEQFECIAREISLAYAGCGALRDSLEAEGADADAALADIGIMVSPERIPVMTAALDRYGVASQARVEKSVRDSALMFIARTAWDSFSRGWPLKSTRYLLSHPLFGELNLNEERLVSEMPEGFHCWQSFLSDESGAKQVFLRLNDFCLYLADENGHTAGELLHALLELSDEQWASRVASDTYDFLSMDTAVREVVACRAEVQRKLELLSELTPALGEAGLVRYAGGDAMAFLTDWSKEADITMEAPLSGVVTLYNSPPPVLASHRLWMMTDVDSSRYPGSPAERSLLGSELRDEVNRQVLGDDVRDAAVPFREWTESDILGLSPDEDVVHLPTLHEKREQKEALFRRMLAVGEDMTLISFSLNDSNGRTQSISSFVQALKSEKSASWRFCCELDAHAAVLEQIDSVRPVYRGVFPRSVSLQRENPLPADSKLRVSLSGIDRWRDCPFSWWCANVARISTPADVSFLEDSAFRGTLSHALWEITWKEYLKGGESLHSTLNLKWDDMLKSLAPNLPAAADPRFSALLSGIRREMTASALLQDAVEERARSSGLVRENTLFEYRLPAYESEHAIFVGKADRVDIWRGVGVVIVDYKSKDAKKYMDNVQLAGYAELLLRSGVPIAGFCYIGQKEAEIRGAWLPEVTEIYKAKSRERVWELDECVESARAVMKELDESIAGGEYRAVYTPDVCKYCSYSLICRRAEMSGVYNIEDGGDYDYEPEE